MQASKQTSLPSRLANSDSSLAERPSFQNRFNPTSVAAQSLDPPARPAATGIRFANVIRTPREAPLTSRNNRAARITRLPSSVGSGPGENRGAPAQWQLNVIASDSSNHNVS